MKNNVKFWRLRIQIIIGLRCLQKMLNLLIVGILFKNEEIYLADSNAA